MHRGPVQLGAQCNSKRPAVAEMALAMLAAVERTNRCLPVPLQMRVGIHSGDVVAGALDQTRSKFTVAPS